jgi:hypothetical protein
VGILGSSCGEDIVASAVERDAIVGTHCFATVTSVNMNSSVTCAMLHLWNINILQRVQISNLISLRSVLIFTFHKMRGLFYLIYFIRLLPFLSYVGIFSAALNKLN